MMDLVSAIERSLSTQNWYSALALSLMLPDICGALAGKPYGGKQYVEWFDEYLLEKYQDSLSGKDCYALRCSFLHEGADGIEKQRVRETLDKFAFIPQRSHCCKIARSQVGDPKYDNKAILQLSVDQFCRDLVDGTKRWLNDHGDSDVARNNLHDLLKIHEGGVHIGGIFIQ